MIIVGSVHSAGVVVAVSGWVGASGGASGITSSRSQSLPPALRWLLPSEPLALEARGIM